MEEQLRVVLALWLDGTMSADTVVEWADRQIERTEAAALPSWLIELSLNGPAACLNVSADLPRPIELSFVDRFALRVLALEPTDRTKVEAFVTWAARAATGEDLDLPEVALSYQLDHWLNDCGRMDQAVAQLLGTLPLLLEKLRSRAETLLSAAA